MSFRLFSQPRKDTASDYVKKLCNREKFQHVKILYNSPTDGLVEDYNDTCFKINSCNKITSIKDYNILQKFNVFYNNLNIDICRNIIKNFDYTINNSNYLKCNISTPCLVKQLINSHDLSCDHIKPYNSSSSNTDNLLIIDPSNLVFDQSTTCSNLFTRSSEAIQYSVDNSSNIVDNTENELILCKNIQIKDIPRDIANIIFEM